MCRFFNLAKWGLISMLLLMHSINATILPSDIVVTYATDMDYMGKYGGYNPTGGPMTEYLGFGAGQPNKNEPWYVFVTVDGGNSGQVGNRKAHCGTQADLRYQVTTPAGGNAALVVPKDFTEYNNSNSIMKLSYSSPAYVYDSFRIYVPSVQSRVPGSTFVDNLNLYCYVMTTTGPVLIGTYSVQIRIPIMNQLSIQSNSAGLVSMGTLRSGQTAPLTILFNYTGNYKISVTVKNGALKHSNPAVTTQVGYTFYDQYQRAYGLPKGVMQQVYTASSSGWERLPFYIQLTGDSRNRANLNNVVAGTYSEEFTFSLETL